MLSFAIFDFALGAFFFILSTIYNNKPKDYESITGLLFLGAYGYFLGFFAYLFVTPYRTKKALREKGYYTLISLLFLFLFSYNHLQIQMIIGTVIILYFTFIIFIKKDLENNINQTT